VLSHSGFAATEFPDAVKTADINATARSSAKRGGCLRTYPQGELVRGGKGRSIFATGPGFLVIVFIIDLKSSHSDAFFTPNAMFWCKL
jgi:hypothetical protein